MKSDDTTNSMDTGGKELHERVAVLEAQQCIINEAVNQLGKRMEAAVGKLDDRLREIERKVVGAAMALGALIAAVEITVKILK